MKTRNLLAASATTLAICILAAPSFAQSYGGPTNLFAQYYTQPGASQVNAAMYPAPHPVPRNVGHTYYTYQPLMPHEMMYTHSRNYYNYYAGPEDFYCHGCSGRGGGSGMTKTTVHWQNGCSHMGPFPFSTVPLQKWYYKLNKKRYCAPRGFSLDGSFRDRIGAHGFGGCASGNCGSYASSFEGDWGGCATGDCAATSNSWAQKAAAATAKLYNGRVQR